MQISACLWSYTETPIEAAQIAAAAGFDSIDVEPGFTTAGERQETVPVTSVAITHLLPEGTAIESDDDVARAAAVEHAKQALGEAHVLGADLVYVVPAATSDPSARHYFTDSVVQLATEAEVRDIRFAIEHFPETGLPSVRDVMAFIDEVSHPNLYLLLDVGHAQISRESVGDALDMAGDRVAFVHFDDNQGEKDDHLALLDGLMHEEDLAAAVAALRNHGYNGPVSVETNSVLSDPHAAMAGSLATLRRIVAGV